VQANPLAPSTSASPSDLFPAPGRGILFAAAPLIVPMQLRLSAVRLKAIVVLVVSRQKGITLVFKNDPLESVDVSSTFDSVAVIQKYLQSEIEGQLREMFREDLPGIIHRLSQRWLSSETERVSGDASQSADAAAGGVPPAVPVGGSGAVAAPPPHAAEMHAAQMASSPPSNRQADHETASAPGGPSSSRRRSNSRVSEAPRAPASTAGTATMSRSPSSARNRRGSRKSLPKAASTSAVPQAGPSVRGAEPRYSFGFGLGGWGAADGLDDIESYDPTYGLRPDALRAPVSSGYSGLARLATQAKGGLRDLTSLGSSPKANTTGSWAGRSPDDSQAVLDESDDALDEAVDDVGTSEEEGSPLPAASRALEHEHEVDLDGLDAIHGPDSESDEENGSGADLSRFGYPPPSAAFSDTAVEASVRRSASLFGAPTAPASPAGTLRGRASSSVSGATPRPSKPRRQIYDTIPAVGGGTVTQPRVYHIASRVQAPEIDEDDDPYEDEEERTARLARSNAGATSAAASSTVRGPASTRTFTLGGGGAPSVHSPLAAPFEPTQRDIHAGRFDSDESGEWDDSSHHSHSHSRSASVSGDGSLATLEPEPMDPRSTAYRTQLYRQRGAGFYRPGYGSSETASQSGSASLSGTSSSRSRSGVYYGAAGARPSLGRHTPSHSTAPTSQYPSTHDIASTVNGGGGGGGKAALPSLHLPERAPQRPMSLDASAHLAELVNSNHTLSPYTRTLETRGFTVRSAPVTPGGSAHASGASTPALSSAGASQYGSSSTDMHAVSVAASRSRASASDRAAPDARPTPHRRRTFKLGGSSKSDVSAPASEHATPTRPGMQRAATERPAATHAHDARSSTSWGAPPSENSHRSSDSTSMRRAALLQQQQLAQQQQQQQQQQGGYEDDQAALQQQHQQKGFAPYAGSGPKSFVATPTAETPVRRRSGRAFVPPSEAALPGASRWAAIRE
jgi:distribution and morphology protein 34